MNKIYLFFNKCGCKNCSKLWSWVVVLLIADIARMLSIILNMGYLYSYL